MAIGSSVNAGNWNKSPKQGVQKEYRFKDTDWSHTFYANAGFPSNSEDRWNARWLEEGKTKFLRFRLFNGQIGTSLSDNKNRHGAAFWERAEVKAGQGKNNVFYFVKNKTYEITFRVRFVKGFTGDRETFFQVHQWQNNCRVGPPIMLKISSQVFHMAYAENNKRHRNVFSANANSASTQGLISVFQLYNKWTEFKLVYGPSTKRDGFASVQLSWNGKIIIEQNEVWQSPCGRPHVKFGIYRPGAHAFPLETSVVDFDYIKITKGEKINFRSNKKDDKVSSAQATKDPYQSYLDNQICAIAKTSNGLWNNQYEDERVWVREAKRRGLDCIDSKLFEAVATSSSDKKVCDKATAPHGDARKWLADLKSDEAIFHIWREEAERRGLSCNVIND